MICTMQLNLNGKVWKWNNGNDAADVVDTVNETADDVDHKNDDDDDVMLTEMMMLLIIKVF